MIALALAGATVLIAIVQIGALPSAFAHPLAAPVLPIVLLAGWSAIRRPAEGWPIPLVAAIVLGAVSETRVGLFLLALLPTLAIATLARRRERERDAPAARRLLLAAGVGAAGTIGYVAVLAVAEGQRDLLVRSGAALVSAAWWTAVLAAMLTGALWRFRARGGGLFT